MAAPTITAITIEDLPAEVLDLIIRKLEMKDVLKCCQLNRNFAGLIKRGGYLLNERLAFWKLTRTDRADLMSEYLKRPGTDASIGDNRAIQRASENGHIKMVKLLLTRDDVDPCAHNNWAIRMACRNGHLEVVKLLLARDDVDPSANDNWATEFASKNGHDKVVELLLARGDVDPSARNNEAIRWANINSRDEVVELLIADPRVQAKGIPRRILKKYGKL